MTTPPLDLTPKRLRKMRAEANESLNSRTYIDWFHPSESEVLALIARAEAAEKAVAAVREALEAHPKACDRHTEDDPIKCGWKRAVADVTRALDGGA